MGAAFSERDLRNAPNSGARERCQPDSAGERQPLRPAEQETAKVHIGLGATWPRRSALDWDAGELGFSAPGLPADLGSVTLPLCKIGIVILTSVIKCLEMY